MKRLLRKLLASQGMFLARTGEFELVPKGNPKCTEAISALYNVTRACILEGLPDPSDQRIALLARLGAIYLPQALYIIDLLNRTAALDGDICEMGVAQGFTSALIAGEIVDGNKQFWLFDSFQGLPAPTEKDVLLHDVSNLGSMQRYEGQMKYPRHLVEENLRRVGFPPERQRIVEGFFDETTPRKTTLPGRVCFAFIDFDFYKPIRDALHYLDTVLVADAVLIVHDYGYFSSGAQTAFDEFYAANRQRYQRLVPHPAANGIAILKRLG